MKKSATAKAAGRRTYDIWLGFWPKARSPMANGDDYPALPVFWRALLNSKPYQHRGPTTQRDSKRLITAGVTRLV
jgi:hypothetical protein